VWLIDKNEGQHHSGEEQEHVLTVTSAIEPSAGDKRPREDDEDQEEIQAPGMRASSVQSQQHHLASHVNGNYGTGGQMNGGGSENDALYIGDLQWVRLSRCLVRHACLSKKNPFCIFGAMAYCSYSGRRTRICDRLR
jgi:hypothetical protein